MIEALNMALHEAMTADERVIVLGQDVGKNEGIFRLTRGLLEQFGEARVIDTPLAEAGIVGAGLGMAVHGLRPVCEIQFSGFFYQAMHQIESHVARIRWRSGGELTAPMVIRMPYGAGVRALEHHSESKEAWFCHTPGLDVVVPSSARDARALLIAAIRSPNPVVFLEPKALYRGAREELPESIDEYEEEELILGRARRLRSGRDLSIICFGAMVPRCLQASEMLAREHDIESDVIDLRTLSPLDDDMIEDTVKSTGRVLIVHEAHRSFGIGAEIIARINDRCLFALQAPVERVTGFDVHVPYFAREQHYLPDARRIFLAARRVLEPVPEETTHVDSF